MILGGLQKLTLIDYPGKLSCTAFLIGCNFRCPWCYSKELVLPEEIKKQPKISERVFFNFLKKRKKFLEGVVLGGGEPTIHKDLPDFIKKIKKMGYQVKLDTNGSNPKMIKHLIDNSLVDYIAMDVKAPKEKYNEAVGIEVDIRKIQESINLLKEEKVDYEFRTTLVPKLLTKEDIVNIAKWLKGAKIYYLQQFRPEKTIDPNYEKYKPFGQEESKMMQKECNRYLVTKLRN